MKPEPIQTKLIAIRLPKELYERLVLASKDTTVSDFVRGAILEKLHKG